MRLARECRRASDEIHCAAHGVLAEERALWPAQPLEPLHVIDLRPTEELTRDVDLVVENARGRARVEIEIELREPADRNLRLILVARVRDTQVRGVLADIG